MIDGTKCPELWELVSTLGRALKEAEKVYNNLREQYCATFEKAIEASTDKTFKEWQKEEFFRLMKERTKHE